MITPEITKKYLKQGYSVFPVKLEANGNKFEKKPVVPWSEYSVRLATEQEVDSWFAFLDFNALGMATGKLSGVLVVDIDDTNSTHGFDSNTAVKTISGGTHLWFKFKPGVRNTVRIEGKPVDVRGEGGFVVVPPSGIGDRQYQWKKYSEELPEFPQIEEVRNDYKPPMTELPQASEGNRNQTAIQVAGHIIASTKRQAWETTAWPALRTWNQESVSPPIEERELRTIFDSASTMEKRNKPQPQEQIHIFSGNTLEQKFSELKSVWGNGLSTGYELLDEWFTLLPGQLYLISAETHFGKTTLAMNISARVAALGYRVLFCSLEQGLFIVPRISSILEGRIPDTFSMLDADKNITTEALIETVNDMPEKPQLIVIDHLHFMEKDMRNGTTSGIDKMMADVQNAAKNLQLPMIIIAHQRKLNGKEYPELDDLRDSSSLSQIPSVILQMSRKRDEMGSLEPTGIIHVNKNRIHGRQGRITFNLDPSGSITLQPYEIPKFTVPDFKLSDAGSYKWQS